MGFHERPFRQTVLSAEEGGEPVTRVVAIHGRDPRCEFLGATAPLANPNRLPTARAYTFQAGAAVPCRTGRFRRSELGPADNTACWGLLSGLGPSRSRRCRE